MSNAEVWNPFKKQYVKYSLYENYLNGSDPKVFWEMDVSAIGYDTNLAGNYGIDLITKAEKLAKENLTDEELWLKCNQITFPIEQKKALFSTVRFKESYFKRLPVKKYADMF